MVEMTHFSVSHFLCNCLWNFVLRWGRDGSMRMFEMTPGLVAFYNMIKHLPSLDPQSSEHFRPKGNPFSLSKLSVN
jgi:hypothetical protein